MHLKFKKFIKSTPSTSGFLIFIRRQFSRRVRFQNSSKYWDDRYIFGGNSGAGSYNKLAVFKSEFINSLILRKKISSVIEYGCGDGNQLRLASYPNYIGYDVSSAAIKLCKDIFGGDETKQFKLLADYNGETADLVLSLDVIYHLVEDDVFEAYMNRIFKSANCFVVIYSSNTDGHEFQPCASHVRHRIFTDWVEINAQGWCLESVTKNKYPYDKNDNSAGSFADFYVYKRIAA